MTYSELAAKVRNGENLFTEFKHKINFPEKIAAELVAFANTQGGWLLVGVDDNKTICGIKNIEEEVFMLDKILNTIIKYPLKYSKFHIPVSDKKSVLAIEVKSSVQKPNFVKHTLEKKEIAYVRVLDRSVQASDLVIKILELQSQNVEIKLKFGDTEKNILQLIDNQGFATVKMAMEKILISQLVAKETLINMVLSGIIKIIPEEGKEDRFLAVES